MCCLAGPQTDSGLLPEFNRSAGRPMVGPRRHLNYETHLGKATVAPRQRRSSRHSGAVAAVAAAAAQAHGLVAAGKKL